MLIKGVKVKSSFSGAYGDNCVEVELTDDYFVKVTDSKNPNGPGLKFTGPEWDAFRKGMINGEFDLPA